MSENILRMFSIYDYFHYVLIQVLFEFIIYNLFYFINKLHKLLSVDQHFDGHRLVAICK